MTERTADTPPMPAISLKIENDLDELKQVTPRVISFLQAHDISSAAAYRVRVAVEELVVNVIRYGYDDTAAHEIDVEVQIDGEWLVVTIEDDGRAFDPCQVPRPDLGAAIENRRVGGWGIHLVRSLSEHIRYQRRADRNVVLVRIARLPRKR